ncbi:hypothetical protein pb186bvf_008406 [Paramecium bursaria]
MRSDLDDLLDDLNDVVDTKDKKNAFQQPQNKTDQQQKKKCIILSIGDQNQYKNCKNLRCTKCDLNVSYFEYSYWREDEVDYLFFRNYYNNKAALQEKLFASPGLWAYNCQCTWFTSKREDQAPKNWVCAGH